MLATLVGWILEIYLWLIIADVIISWLPYRYRYHPIAILIDRLVQPVLYHIRRALRPYNTGPFDFSPMIAIFLIWILQMTLVPLLARYAP